MIVSVIGALVAAMILKLIVWGRELGRDLHGQMIVSVTRH
jgi:hypothetical protein